VVQFWFLSRRRYVPIVDRPSLGRALLKAAALIFVLAGLHILAMMAYEELSAFDGLWLTLTTLMTVGYGDLAAKTVAGRWSTILLLYVGGIYTLANLASQLFLWRTDARERKWRGLWRWRMKDHLLILNSPSDHPFVYFERLLGQLRATERFADCPILIITRAFEQGLPESLARLGAAHITAWGLDFEALHDAAPERARAIAILAKSEAEPNSDSVTLDAVTRIRALGCTAHVVAECIDGRNRERMFKAGASTIVRPTRVFPEIMARALAHPGAEKVLEEIIDAGGTECERIDVAWEGAWKDLVARLIAAEAGTAIGYEARDGAVRVNPSPSERISARAVFALVSGSAPESTRAKARAALSAATP
jgi:voltage-gated potassium channel